MTAMMQPTREQPAEPEVVVTPLQEVRSEMIALAEKFDQVKGLDLLPAGYGKVPIARATAPDMINPLTGEPGRVTKNGDNITNRIVGKVFSNHGDAYAADCKM